MRHNPTSLEQHLASHAPQKKKKQDRAIAFIDSSAERTSQAVVHGHHAIMEKPKPKTKKELRAEKKALRRAAHLKAMQDEDESEESEENYRRRTADPPAYVATNEGDIVAAPTSPPRARAEARSPDTDSDGEVEVAEKKPPQIRGILKKSTLPRGAVTRDSEEVSGSSDDEEPEVTRKPSISIESLAASSASSSMYQSEPGMSAATMSATTVSGLTTVMSTATSSADTVSHAESESTEPTKNTGVRKKKGAEKSAVATIDEGNDGGGNEDTADLGTSAFWEDAIEKKEEELIEKKIAAVDGSDRSGKSGVDRSDRSGKSDKSGSGKSSRKGGVDGSDRSGKSGVDGSDRSGKSKSKKDKRNELDNEQPQTKSDRSARRSSSGWNEMIERKMESKKLSKKKSKKRSQRRLDDGDENAPTAAVIAHANDAVQNWKENSGPMHDEDGDWNGGQKSPDKRGTFDDGLTPEEAAEKREKQKRRLMMLSVCLLLLLILIFGLAFGLRSGGDDGASGIEEANDVGETEISTTSPAPSAKPTLKPTVPGMWIFDTPVVAVPSPSVTRMETVHSVDLILDNVPDDYVMPAPVRNSILSFIRDMIDRELSEDDIELIGVSYADENGGNERRLLRSTRLRLATITLPLLIKVVGPADISDIHLSYIMAALEDTTDLREYLKMLDKKSFKSLVASFESEMFEQPATLAPAASSPGLGEKTMAPVTAQPTQLPTLPPSPQPSTGQPSKFPTQQPTAFIPRRCDGILMTCPDGSKVAQNPLQDCDFFPCPNQQMATSSSPTKPPVKPAATFRSPTAFPVTGKPTFSPSDGPSASPVTDDPTSRPTAITESPTPKPSPPPTQSPTNKPTPPPTQSPTTEAPTDEPTLRPTTMNALVCSPDSPNAQCGGAGMALLEKCSSSDTVAKDQYGHALAMAAGRNGVIYAVVGSPKHDVSGSAYLISYDQAAAQWKHVIEIIPGGASANGGFEGEEIDRSYDQFGYAVALNREWVAISAPFDTASTGRVSLFWLDGVISGGLIVPDAELVASDGNFLARFGSSLDIDGNTLVIGANKDRGNMGSAYIFQYSAGEWVEIAKLAPDDVSVDSQGNFGQSVAISQGIVVVGAPMDGTNGRRRNGSVYVYSDTGSFLQKIVPFELLGGDQFGYSVAVQTSTNPSTNAQETRIAIGARMRDDQGIDSGSVYLYTQRDGEGEFSFEEKLTPFAWATGAEMGSSLAMEGDKLIVGARRKDGPGGAYLYHYDGLTWSDKESVTPLGVGAGQGDDFGSAVAMASSVALIGSHSNDEAGEDGGALYSYAVCD